MRRPCSLVSACLLALTACVASAGSQATQPRDLTAFRGLGTWVDAYDYATAFQSPGAKPPVTPRSVDEMARLGVRTLFLQASMDDPRSPDALVDRKLIEQFVVRAHARGIKVVAWYLPKLVDIKADYTRLMALRDFQIGTNGFDGFAVDIEWTKGVPDLATRNDRLVVLSQAWRASTKRPIGAIVLPPVQLEVVNPALWPSFPWRRLRDLYDVWMPMDYWTFRSTESGYRDAFRYVDESTRRMRANLGRPGAAVHVIGGIADVATSADYEALRRAVRVDGAIGWSMYDFRTTTSGAWPLLRAIATR